MLSFVINPLTRIEISFLNCLFNICHCSLIDKQKNSICFALSESLSFLQFLVLIIIPLSFALCSFSIISLSLSFSHCLSPIKLFKLPIMFNINKLLDNRVIYQRQSAFAIPVASADQLRLLHFCREKLAELTHILKHLELYKISTPQTNAPDVWKLRMLEEESLRKRAAELTQRICHLHYLLSENNVDE